MAGSKDRADQTSANARFRPRPTKYMIFPSRFKRNQTP